MQKSFFLKKSITDIVCWHENITTAQKMKFSIKDSFSKCDQIHFLCSAYNDKKTPPRIIYSDASNSGLVATSEENETGGPFSVEENKYHATAK